MCSGIFLTILCVSGTILAEANNPLVRTAHGLIQGSWKVSTNGKKYASFTGMPYARPPVGKYRFREPQQIKPWTGIWDSTKHGARCLQYDAFIDDVIGSENCLFVNVYTPELNAGASLPVVVFIHGGAFMYGSSDVYDPKHLMNKDVVAVTFNYRLGPLGFLSTGDEVIPGNAGLKDQAFALHWIKNNIVMFGGNPDSVTLTGCSAGGASVNYHYLSPLSKGTFARGIAFSGSSFASWTHQKRPAQKAKTLASIIGCPVANSHELADCLRYRPAESIVRAQTDMFDWKVRMFTIFTPTTEAPGTREPFISLYPYLAAQAGQMHKLPLITSVCSEEGLYPAASYQEDASLLPELDSHWEQLASHIFEYNDTLPLKQRAEVAKKIKDRYLGAKHVGQDTFPQLVQALGDRLFVADVGRLAQIHAKRSGQPVYMYRYSYRGDFSLSNLMANNKQNYGVSHADDVFRVWEYSGLPVESTRDKQMTEKLIDMIYSYATIGVPRFDNVQWNPVSPGSPDINYLEISSPNEAQMKSTSDFGQKTFWDSLGFIENEHYNQYFKDEL